MKKQELLIKQLNQAVRTGLISKAQSRKILLYVEQNPEEKNLIYSDFSSANEDFQKEYKNWARETIGATLRIIEKSRSHSHSDAFLEVSEDLFLNQEIPPAPSGNSCCMIL